VYRLPDPVLDVASLLEALATPHIDAIFSIDWNAASLRRTARRASLLLPGVVLQPECLLFTAGSGNEALIAALGATGPAMQRRPLQQVLVKHEYPEPLFGHCVGRGPVPRITVSSHRTADGQPLWYLGGKLADAGAAEAPEALIRRAQAELAAVLPWIDLGATEWRTLTLDRAEPRRPGTRRPDAAFVGPVDGLDNALVGWPCKLALAPQLGEMALATLRDRGITPRYRWDATSLAGLQRPGIAAPAWDIPPP
jgi:hypothetical protein